MDVSSIDKNSSIKRVKVEDFEWFDVFHKNVSLHGVFYDQTDMEFKRLPKDVAKNVRAFDKKLLRK